MQVYGVLKIWKQMNRKGIVVARCTVARLMKLQGLRGVVHVKRVRTTIPNIAALRPLDRVNRQCKAVTVTITRWLKNRDKDKLRELASRGQAGIRPVANIILRSPLQDHLSGKCLPRRRQATVFPHDQTGNF